LLVALAGLQLVVVASVAVVAVEQVAIAQVLEPLAVVRLRNLNLD
jgi:hypothetical protein